MWLELKISEKEDCQYLTPLGGARALRDLQWPKNRLSRIKMISCGIDRPYRDLYRGEVADSEVTSKKSYSHPKLKKTTTFFSTKFWRRILKSPEEISKNPSFWTQVLPIPLWKAAWIFSKSLPLGGVCGRNPGKFCMGDFARSRLTFPRGAPLGPFQYPEVCLRYPQVSTRNELSSFSNKKINSKNEIFPDTLYHYIINYLFSKCRQYALQSNFTFDG